MEATNSIDILCDELKKVIFNSVLAPISAKIGKTVEELATMIPTKMIATTSGVNLSNLMKTSVSAVGGVNVGGVNVGKSSTALETRDPTKCCYQFSRGINKKKYCGKAKKDSSEFCSAHAKTKAVSDESTKKIDPVNTVPTVNKISNFPNGSMKMTNLISAPETSEQLVCIRDESTGNIVDKKTGLWIEMTDDSKTCLVRGKRFPNGNFVEAITRDDLEFINSKGYQIGENVVVDDTINPENDSRETNMAPHLMPMNNPPTMPMGNAPTIPDVTNVPKPYAPSFSIPPQFHPQNIQPSQIPPQFHQ